MRSTPLALCLATTTLSFGSVTIGTPVSETLTLSSTGTAAVTVSAVKIAGAGFTVSGATFPVTLNPGIAVKLQVQFNPTAAGTVSGSVTISSNSSTGASTGVPLSATGVAAQHKVNLSWAAPVNSPVPVSGYEVYRALSGSTSFQLLNSTLRRDDYGSRCERAVRLLLHLLRGEREQREHQECSVGPDYREDYLRTAAGGGGPPENRRWPACSHEPWP